MTEPPIVTSRGLEVTAEQAAAVDKVVRFIVRFSMTVPAILALEGMRPLSYVGSQFMHVLSPAVVGMLSFSEWDQLAGLLEDRRGLDYVIEQIEDADLKRGKR